MKQIILFIIFFLVGVALGDSFFQQEPEVRYVNIPVPYAHLDTGAGSAGAEVPSMIVVKERESAATTPASTYGYIYALSTTSAFYIISDDGTARNITDSYSPILTKTADYTVTTADFGKSILVNSSGTVTLTLPSVGTDENGAKITFVKCAAGKLIIDAADSDKIADSGAGDTIYNDTATQIYSDISLQYIHLIATWVIRGAHGTWVTTD